METDWRRRRRRNFLIGQRPGGKCGPIFEGGGWGVGHPPPPVPSGAELLKGALGEWFGLGLEGRGALASGPVARGEGPLGQGVDPQVAQTVGQCVAVHVSEMLSTPQSRGRGGGGGGDPSGLDADYPPKTKPLDPCAHATSSNCTLLSCCRLYSSCTVCWHRDRMLLNNSIICRRSAVKARDDMGRGGTACWHDRRVGPGAGGRHRTTVHWGTVHRDTTRAPFKGEGPWSTGSRGATTTGPDVTPPPSYL